MKDKHVEVIVNKDFLSHARKQLHFAAADEFAGPIEVSAIVSSRTASKAARTALGGAAEIGLETGGAT